MRNLEKQGKGVDDSTPAAATVINIQNVRDKKLADELKIENQSKSQQEELKSPRKTALFAKFTAEDFFEGQPELKVRFTEVVRKFNHEMMKSTCQVMKGCKSWKATEIATSVFALLDQILAYLS